MIDACKGNGGCADFFLLSLSIKYTLEIVPTYSDISSKVVIVMSSTFQTIKSFDVTVNVKFEFNFCIYAMQCSILVAVNVADIVKWAYAMI